MRERNWSTERSRNLQKVTSNHLTRRLKPCMAWWEWPRPPSRPELQARGEDTVQAQSSEELHADSPVAVSVGGPHQATPLGPSGALCLTVSLGFMTSRGETAGCWSKEEFQRDGSGVFVLRRGCCFFLSVKKYTQAWEPLLFSVNYWRTSLNSAPRTSLGLKLEIRWLDLSSPGTGVAAGVQMGHVERRGAVFWGLLWSTTSASAGRCPQGAPLQQSHPEEALPGSGCRG